jgi:hypothetical protein
MFRLAADAGLVTSLALPPAPHRDPAVFSARLVPAPRGAAAAGGASLGDEADLACPLALGREELLAFMRGNVYRFDSLQVCAGERTVSVHSCLCILLYIYYAVKVYRFDLLQVYA